MYTAVVLNNASQTTLRNQLNALPSWKASDFVYCTERGQVLPHHMTLHMGGLSPKYRPDLAGSVVTLTIDAFCWCEVLGVCAARVSDFRLHDQQEVLKCANAQPHITMCLRPKGKPVYSNKLPWDRAFTLSKPLVLEGNVEECV